MVGIGSPKKTLKSYEILEAVEESIVARLVEEHVLERRVFIGDTGDLLHFSFVQEKTFYVTLHDKPPMGTFSSFVSDLEKEVPAVVRECGGSWECKVSFLLRLTDAARRKVLSETRIFNKVQADFLVDCLIKHSESLNNDGLIISFTDIEGGEDVAQGLESSEG